MTDDAYVLLRVVMRSHYDAMATKRKKDMLPLVLTSHSIGVTSRDVMERARRYGVEWSLDRVRAALEAMLKGKTGVVRAPCGYRVKDWKLVAIALTGPKVEHEPTN